MSPSSKIQLFHFQGGYISQNQNVTLTQNFFILGGGGYIGQLKSDLGSKLFFPSANFKYPSEIEIHKFPFQVNLMCQKGRVRL